MNTSRLLAKLESMGGVLGKPATELEIQMAQDRLHCSFPPGILELFRNANGLSQSTDEDIWDFYPLERLYPSTHSEPLVLSSGEAIRRSSLLRFCDVSLDAVCYAFCADPSLPYFGHFYGDEQEVGWHVASSYEEFIEIFVSQSDKLLLNLN